MLGTGEIIFLENRECGNSTVYSYSYSFNRKSTLSENCLDTSKNGGKQVRVMGKEANFYVFPHIDVYICVCVFTMYICVYIYI